MASQAPYPAGYGNRGVPHATSAAGIAAPRSFGALSPTPPSTATASGSSSVNGGLPSNGGLLQSLGRSFSSMIATPTVKAVDYIPDASDEIDLELAEYLKVLSPEAANKLRLFRKARGSYDIGGRQVSLLRTDASDDEEDGEIVVREEGMADDDAFTSLETYLEQTANVAMFMENKPPHKKDLTFGDARIPDDTDPFTARLMCMRMACDQAERRQAHNDTRGRPPQQLSATAIPLAAARATAVANRAGASAKNTDGKAEDLDTVYASKPVNEKEGADKVEAEKAAPPRPRSWWEMIVGHQSESEDSSSGSEDDAK